MDVSVALATFNGSRFLRDQLESIAGQTVLPSELVVSDDGSSDDTLAILQNFSGSAPFPVRVLPPHQRLGFADNFLHTIQNCNQPLVVLADQDDVWFPTKVELARARMMADRSLLSLHALTLTTATLEPIGDYYQGIRGNACFEPLALDPYMTGWGNTMMVRRDLAMAIDPRARPRHPGSDRPLSHDTWLYTLAAALGRVSQISAPLILYRQHGQNVFGFRKGTVVDRLKEISTVPVQAYHERVEFCDAMSSLLAELSTRGLGEFSEAAGVAAERFAERRDRARLRLTLHEEPSLRARISAYAALRQRSRSDAASPGSLSAAKDLTLGVLGLGRLSRGLSAGQTSR